MTSLSHGANGERAHDPAGFYTSLSRRVDADAVSRRRRGARPGPGALCKYSAPTSSCARRYVTARRYHYYRWQLPVRPPAQTHSHRWESMTKNLSSSRSSTIADCPFARSDRIHRKQTTNSFCVVERSRSSANIMLASSHHRCSLPNEKKPRFE